MPDASMKLRLHGCISHWYLLRGYLWLLWNRWGDDTRALSPSFHCR